MLHVGHAAEAIAAGKCKVALITLAGRPRAEGMATGTVPRSRGGTPTPDEPFEFPYGPTVVNMYAMCAMRHMYEFGTTAEQLAWIKVAASHHAQYNPHALLKDVVTVEEVVNSPMISDPLHRLDCCVITDGGGAIVVVAPEIAAKLKRPKVKLIGAGEFVKTQMGGKVDLTYSGARFSGAAAFAEAGVKPADIKFAAIYDSFTITVLMQLEDLGFCEKGKGGAFVADGNLISGVGKLPFNTDGGGLCSNHPGNRGGLTKVLEAVRQLRGEAHPKVQVKNCDLAHRPRHRRLARPAPRQRHRHPGEGVVRWPRRKDRKLPAPAVSQETQAYWDAAAKGKLLVSKCTALRPGAPLSAHDLSVLLQRQDRMDRGVGQGHDLLLQRDAPRAGALRHGLCDPGRGPAHGDQHRRLRPRQAEVRAGR